MKFPKVVEAFAAMEKCQWRIGDALLEEAPIGEDTGRNGAFDVIDECAEELEARGFSTPIGTLRKYRSVAGTFPPAHRRAGLSWTAHAEAGSPEMLAAIIKIAGRKQISKREVSHTRDVVEQHQAREWREEQRAAGIERKPVPKFNKPTPIETKHLGGLRLMAELLKQVSNLENASTAIDAAIEFVRDNLARLDSEETEYFTETAIEIADKARKLGEAAQRLAARRKKHLSVVGE